jgi:hypothetical protein
MFNKYKTFIKRFIGWYVAANVLIALFLIMFAPDVLDKAFKGETYGQSAEMVRVQNLSKQIELTDVSIDECPNDDGMILACYNPATNKTFVTSLGLTLSDYELLCVLRHEAIHKWQDENGIIEYDYDGKISNSEELEAYAYANDGC